MGREAAARRWAEKVDRDPSKWPDLTMPSGTRVFMVDCEFCPSRMSLKAMAFHIRRHARRQDVTP